MQVTPELEKEPGYGRALRDASFLGPLVTIVLLATACGGLAPPPQTPLLANIALLETTLIRKSASTDWAQSPDQVQARDVENDDPLTRLWRAQSSRSGQSVKFERISLEHGLSESVVNCIIQDSKGFMWFGTQDGLNKYDGYSFTVYRPIPGVNSLAHNFVRSIYEDSSGALWIGTDGSGLDKFDRDSEQFTHYRADFQDRHSLSSDWIRSVYEDREGVLWIGTVGGGLNRFDQEQERFSRYQYHAGDPHSLSDDTVLTIYQDREGVLWIGTNGGGLNRFDRDKEQFVHYRHIPSEPYSLSNDRVQSIFQDREGVLWVGTADGLDRLDPASGQFKHYRHVPGDAHSLSENSVQSIYEDREGVLWIGTTDGLNKFDHAQDQFIRYFNDPRDTHSLSNDSVLSIYQDREGVLWFGTFGGGLNKLNRHTNHFAHYYADPNDPNSLSGNQIWSIYEDREGILWIGTFDEGLNRFDRDAGQYTLYRHDPERPFSLGHDRVRVIFEDQEGVLWIGTAGGGLDRFDRSSEQFFHYRHDPGDPYSLSSNRIRSIYQDREGVLWIGTAGGGLNRFDRDKERFIRYEASGVSSRSLSNSWVQSIYQDQDGMLWLATGGSGLDRFDPDKEQFTHYQHDPRDAHSLSHDQVMTIYEDRSGVLWVGTFGGGLNKFDREKETFVRYREKDGLPNDVVYGILEDDQGFLWLSTNKGLSRFDPQTETFKNYDVDDGLQSNEFNQGAYHKSRSGEMFFGGINGFNAFYPENIKEDNPYLPPVVLTLLQQGNENLGVGVAPENVQKVTLRWPNNFFEFEFAALGYSQPEKNQYAYRLEGFDKEWNYVGVRRFGRYTNVPGGTYTLRIKGSNSDGVWNEQGLSIKVTVVPPLWERRWFQGVVALLLVAGVAGGYRLRIQSIKARNRELETLVEERTRALEERTREKERRRKELEALYRADAELHRLLSLDEVLQALVDIAVDIVRADKSSLLVWDDRRERLVVRVARGFKAETLAQMSFAPGQGTVGHVAATGEPVIVEDARTNARIARRHAITDLEGIRSFMQVPIQVGGEVFGVFSADYVQPHAFGDDEQRLFIALAQRAALAIDTAQLYEKTQELAVLEERNRLARDLHDAVTQTLFSASIIAEVLPRLWESDQDEGRQLLQELRQLSRGALAEMRTLLLELRPAALVEANLSDLIHQLAEAVTGREGVPVAVTVQDQCVLPPQVHVALYRIAQEALNNAVKHAQASQVTVSLRCAPPPSPPPAGGKPAGQERRVELRVSDNGCGFDPDCVLPDHLGLGIIRERAEAIGAKLKIKSQPGSGTQVVVTWEEGECR